MRFCTRDPLSCGSEEGAPAGHAKPEFPPGVIVERLPGGDERRDRRPPQKPSCCCPRRGRFKVCAMHPTSPLWVCSMHPKTPETVSPARELLARASSLVAERETQGGWKIDNGGRWPAPPSLRENAPEAFYGGAACYTKSADYERLTKPNKRLTLVSTHQHIK